MMHQSNRNYLVIMPYYLCIFSNYLEKSDKRYEAPEQLLKISITPISAQAEYNLQCDRDRHP